MTPVTSSNIKAVGLSANGKLRVQFHSGTIYEYDDAAHHHGELLKRDRNGLGSYFHVNVRHLNGRQVTESGS